MIGSWAWLHNDYRPGPLDGRAPWMAYEETVMPLARAA